MNDSIIDYYNNYDEEGRLTQDKAQKLEYITTTYVLDKIIPKESKLLELGAGTGRYSFYYAKQGHQVTATDVVPKHIEEMENKFNNNQEIKNMEIELMDAADLSSYQDNIFDVVLSLGPLYHMRKRKKRQQSVKESLRVLKEDGILAVAYINKFFVLALLAQNNNLREDYIDMILKSGKVEGEPKNEFLANAYFSSPKEIEELLNQFNTKKLDHIGTDGIAILLQDMLNVMDDDEYKNWFMYHLETCNEKSLLGYSNHGLYISKKEG